MKIYDYILDALVDGSEAETQIIEFLRFCEIEVELSDLRKVIKKMIDDDLITIDDSWVNENGEKPYRITEKGFLYWENTILSE